MSSLSLLSAAAGPIALRGKTMTLQPTAAKGHNKALTTLASYADAGLLASLRSASAPCLVTEKQTVSGGTNNTYAVPLDAVPGAGPLYVASRLAPVAALADAESISIVTGTCLFSALEALAILQDGTAVSLVDPAAVATITQPVVGLRLPGAATVYEQETAIRLCTAINALAVLDNKPVTVQLAVPKVEYYLYLLPLVQQGLLPLDLLQVFIDAVDQRSAANEAMYRQMLRVPVQRMAPLDCAEDLVKTEMQAGRVPTAGQLQAQLAASSPVAADVLATLAQPGPLGLQGIARASYALGMLLPAAVPRQAVIAIDTPDEEQVLLAAQRLAEGVRQQAFAALGGLFVSPSVVASCGAPSTYFYRPADEVRDMAVVRGAYLPPEPAAAPTAPAGLLGRAGALVRGFLQQAPTGGGLLLGTPAAAAVPPLVLPQGRSV